jgi:hypothetical protein
MLSLWGRRRILGLKALPNPFDPHKHVLRIVPRNLEGRCSKVCRSDVYEQITLATEYHNRFASYRENSCSAFDRFPINDKRNRGQKKGPCASSES